MSILLWITIEMEYKIKCLKFILLFTNGRQKQTAKGLLEKTCSSACLFTPVLSSVMSCLLGITYLVVFNMLYIYFSCFYTASLRMTHQPNKVAGLSSEIKSRVVFWPHP